MIHSVDELGREKVEEGRKSEKSVKIGKNRPREGPSRGLGVSVEGVAVAAARQHRAVAAAGARERRAAAHDLRGHPTPRAPVCYPVVIITWVRYQLGTLLNSTRDEKVEKHRIEESLVSNSSLVSGLSEASRARLSWVEVSQKV